MEFTKVEEKAVAETVLITEEIDTRELAALRLAASGGGFAEVSLV